MLETVDQSKSFSEKEVISEDRSSLCVYLGEYKDLQRKGRAILRDRFLKRKTAVFDGSIIALWCGDRYLLGRVLSVKKKQYGFFDVEVTLFFD